MRGFTLIELSIVLVVIGLIVGGVLVGRDLINAAAVRSQVSQIEKLQTATNTFLSKYSYLPGDLREPEATNFGFTARGVNPGQGDGNGVLESYVANSVIGSRVAGGENGVFWVDLSTAHLVDGTFSTAIISVSTPTFNGATIPLYFPAAKLGAGSYPSIYAYSGLGNNYFGLTTISQIIGGSMGGPVVTPLTPNQAYAIDKKMDDGLPALGNVAAFAYIFNGSPSWSRGYNDINTTFTDPVTGSSTTCYDNAGITLDTMQYSILAGGNSPNCALSFKMK